MSIPAIDEATMSPGLDLGWVLGRSALVEALVSGVLAIQRRNLTEEDETCDDDQEHEQADHGSAPVAIVD
jgi:hypothetical protein